MKIGSPYLLPQLSYFRICSCQGRCAYMWRSSKAKHCSSLCSQSEGDEYCGGQTRLKIQRRYALKRWLYSLRVRGPHFASKVSYNAGAATDDDVGQRKSPLRGRCCQYLIFYLEHPKVMHRPCNPYTFWRTQDEARANAGRRSIASRPAFVRASSRVRHQI